MHLSEWEIESTCILPEVVGFSTWINVKWKTQSGLRFFSCHVAMDKVRISTHKNDDDPFIFFSVYMAKTVCVWFPFILVPHDRYGGITFSDRTLATGMVQTVSKLFFTSPLWGTENSICYTICHFSEPSTHAATKVVMFYLRKLWKSCRIVGNELE